MAAKTFQPFLFLRRGRVWTIVYPGPGGAKRQRATKFRGGGDPEVAKAEEAKARKALALFTVRWQAGRLVERDEGGGPLTVTRWAKKFLRSREAKGISTVDDYRSRLEHHVLPAIGHLRIEQVSPEHIAEMMAAIAADGKLAPRTQLHVYSMTKTMFSRAIPRHIETNPCCIPAEDLPANKDEDPEWRPTAIFTREEVQKILTDDRIPVDRRTFYAVLFLGGMRFGEIAALKLRHYVPGLAPLGQLQVVRSYNSKKRLLKGVKTERPRNVPVHPWLARILDAWLAIGWAEMMGRAPGPDDILIPSRRGRHRNSSTMWTQLNGTAPAKRRSRANKRARVYKCRTCGGGGHGPNPCPKAAAAAAAAPTGSASATELGDLRVIGLRPRRQHDARRTFISLARADGARKDLLRMVTHGPEGDSVDIYTEMPWAPLCEEVAKLRIGPPVAAPLTLVPAGARARAKSARSQGPGLPQGCHSENPLDVGGVILRPQRDSNPHGVDGQPASPSDSQPQTAAIIGFDTQGQAAPEAPGGQSTPSLANLAILATLALRQALAALERGRMDLAMDILRRAIADEAAAGAGRAGEVG